MILYFAQISDGDKAFWGSVIGAFIGTVGAFVVALFAVWADRRKRKANEAKAALRQYNQQLIACEVALNEYLPAMLKNVRLLGDCASATTPGHFLMTLPRPMELKSEGKENLRNAELFNSWLTLTTRAKIVNQLIEDFTNAYTDLHDSVFDALLKKLPYDAKLITEQHQILVSFAQDCKKAVEDMVDTAIEMLARVQLHGEIGKSSNKFKQPTELDAFKLKQQKIRARVKKLKNQFNLNTIFQNV